MAHAVTVAAEPAAEAAEQVDDHQDDQDRPKRHGALPEANGGRNQPPRRLSSKAYSRPRVPARCRALRSNVNEPDRAAPKQNPARPVPGRAGLKHVRGAWALFRLQLQRRRVDAVAQSGRSRAVIEDMAEMAGAFRAQHLGADHAVGGVPLLVDMTIDRRLGEARPAAAGIELG